MEFPLEKVVDETTGEERWEIVCRPREMFGGMGGRRITDQEATRSFEKFIAEVKPLRLRANVALGAPIRLMEVRLPSQHLGDRAVRSFVQALVRGNVQIQVVELYRNHLGDAGAQALSTLLERVPAPGLQRLHLSHNYFSNVGVGLLLVAAVRCNRYPIAYLDRNNDERTRPLWLRVENQLVPWPALIDAAEDMRLVKAQMLIDHLGKRLLEDFKDQGLFPAHLSTTDPLDKFHMFCIPRIDESRWTQNADNEFVRHEDASQEGTHRHAGFCSSFRCRNSTAHGPLVHLPWFHQQNQYMKGGRKDLSRQDSKPPEAALLCEQDTTWKTWAPRRPAMSGYERRQLENAGLATGQPSMLALPQLERTSSASVASGSQAQRDLPVGKASSQIVPLSPKREEEEREASFASPPPEKAISDIEATHAAMEREMTQAHTRLQQETPQKKQIKRSSSDPSQRVVAQQRAVTPRGKQNQNAPAGMPMPEGFLQRTSTLLSSAKAEPAASSQVNASSSQTDTLSPASHLAVDAPVASPRTSTAAKRGRGRGLPANANSNGRGLIKRDLSGKASRESVGLNGNGHNGNNRGSDAASELISRGRASSSAGIVASVADTSAEMADHTFAKRLRTDQGPGVAIDLDLD